MGLLTVGEPLSWTETKALAEFVREHGIEQFLNIFHARRHKGDDTLKWGDEVEYIVLEFDHQNRKVRLALRASTELLTTLQKPEEAGETDLSSLWRPEFAAYMIEGTPGVPYGISPTPLEHALKHKCSLERIDQLIDEIALDGGLETAAAGSGTSTPTPKLDNCADDDDEENRQSKRGGSSPLHMFAFFKDIEENMRLRRREVMSLLRPNEAILSISSFPRSGTLDSCSPPTFVGTVDGTSKSLFFPDEAINPGHPRFGTLSKHICERRGGPANIQVPIFRDVNTASPFVEDFFAQMNIDRAALSPEQLTAFEVEARARERRYRQADHIFLDSMGFGMGCCCLQVTFGASNVCEARLLYDQLTPLTPILMAMSAASPAHRGYLTDRDCRWAIIAGSVDDRTEAEITGTDPATGEAITTVRRIPKSRYDSVDLYIYPTNKIYNDIEIVRNEKAYSRLIESGVDELLAEHISHLFIRDPLVLFKEKLDIDDKTESDHFENIQSTNWQSMRFKPPPPGAKEIGWRVEFRPMEVQLTDEENAAFVVFIVLMTRLILSFNLDMLIPISRVEENMKEGQKRNAVLDGLFWFRKDLSLPQCVLTHFAANECEAAARIQEQVTPCLKRNDVTKETMYTKSVKMSVDEIINGSHKKKFPGLLPLLHAYLDSMKIEALTRCSINKYLQIIANRANGTNPTPANVIRSFIYNHPDYKQDSIVNDSVNYDLMKQIWSLQKDEITLKDLVNEIDNMKNTKRNN